MIVVCAFGNKYLDEFFDFLNIYNKNTKILIIQNDIYCKEEFFKKVEVLNKNFSGEVFGHCEENLRELGSWCKAYALFPKEDWYCFVHDNMFLKFEASKKVYEDDVFALATIGGWRGVYNSMDYVLESLDILKIQNPDPIVIFGCSFVCSNKTMDRLVNFGLDKIIAKTRRHACATERILGVVFNHMNINIVTGTKKIPRDKNRSGYASVDNPIRSSNPLFEKIRSVRRERVK